MDLIETGNNVLYLWQTDTQIEANISAIKAIANVSVSAENWERIQFAAHPAKTFDAAVLSPSGDVPTEDILAIVLRLLKPQGRLIVLQPNNVDVLKTRLLFGGFLKATLSGNDVTAVKPNYEVGSAAKLGEKNGSAKVAAWKIDNDDDDIIDADDLLDEEDLAKPDPTSLRVCGTTGKRKACKDCSCGLAEELDAENGAGGKADTAPAQKSSCGSCYLGDAFRCASCPYLGMPAFKPGEKIQLNDNLMNADS